MSRIPKTRFFLAVYLLLCVVVFLAVETAPAGAQNVRDKFKRTFGGDKDEDPNVKITETPAGAETTAGKAGLRDVLVVTVPLHKAKLEIAEGKTIAFIDFRHIEREVAEPEWFETIVEKREEVIYSSDGPVSEVSTEIKSQRYSTDVCAAQVAAAIAQHLADLNRYQIVTRDRIKNILEEQKLNYSGSVNTATAVKLGELIGADYLIYGQVQLCVTNSQNFATIAKLAQAAAGEKDGFLANLVGVAKELKPERLRSFVMAQIQVIDADTGKQVFTTSLRGEFNALQSAFDFDMDYRELVARAADALANEFIDSFLARREKNYIGLYSHVSWDYDQGIDLIQLGDCAAAERHFRGLSHYSGKMSAADVAKLMYNHGVALMCANRAEDALDRLWASLRLSNDKTVFAAIDFTNDIIDRGRQVEHETDPIITSIRSARFPAPPPAEPAPGSGQP